MQTSLKQFEGRLMKQKAALADLAACHTITTVFQPSFPKLGTQSPYKVKHKGRLKRSVLEMKTHGQAVKGELLPFIARGTFVQHA